MTGGKRLVVLVAALGLAACSVGPDYQRPDTATPAAWTGKTDTTAAWPALDWWQGFAAPGLDGFMRDAEQANFDIQAAVARVREADAQVQIAGGALWPTVGFSSGVSRTHSSSTSRPSSRPEAPMSGINAYQAAFSASYQLDFWGRYADAVDSARATADATRFDRQTTALTVEANVANTYFAIAALDDRLKVARDNLVTAREILDAFRARLEAGTANALDVAQQESVVAAQQATLAPLVQQRQQNAVALAILAGKLPEDVRIPSGTLEALRLPAVGPGLPSGLLARRPDVQFAESQLKAANADTKAAVASLFPNVALTAQGGMVTTATSALLTPGSLLYSLGASLTQPVFQGGALEGGIELRRARYDELVQTYRKAVVSAFGDVETALNAVSQAAQQERDQGVATDTAQRANEIAQAQLYSGTVDILTVLNTQRTLFQAQDLLVQAKLVHAQAVVGLFKALGGGWQREG
jgi:outer membrane protein, multidrug efflux system